MRLQELRVAIAHAIIHLLVPRDVSKPLTRAEFDVEFEKYYKETDAKQLRCGPSVLAALEIFNRRLWGPRL